MNLDQMGDPHNVSNGGVGRPNLKDAVATQIRDRILSGQWKPGSKIDQDSLAKELGISKLPVREALISLEQENLVRNLPRRGSFVSDLSRRDVRDHFELYGRVAALAAEFAAPVISEQQLLDLDRLTQAMERARDPIIAETLNHQFHRIINQASGSPRLQSVIRVFASSIPTHFYEFGEDWKPVAERQHIEIVEALRSRDPIAAGSAISAHLSASGRHAVRYLESTGFWDDESELSDTSLHTGVGVSVLSQQDNK